MDILCWIAYRPLECGYFIGFIGTVESGLLADGQMRVPGRIRNG